MRRILRGAYSVVASGCLAACGGGSHLGPAPLPISVSLAVSTVTISQSGAPVTVGINIVSTSETGTVLVTGLPTGVKETYASSDTNPSGTLLFSASMETPAGTYQPTILVNSAGASAMTSFTLVVTAPAHATIKGIDPGNDHFVIRGV